MERLKLPAGRLATVFYKTQPQHAGSRRQSISGDAEKGTSEDTLAPISIERSRRSARMSPNLLDRKEHAFAWRNVTLDINVNGTQKRLLDGIDGKPLASPPMFTQS